MRTKSLVLLLLLASLGLKFPEPIGYVNDFANILTNQEEYTITKIAEMVERETTAELAVVTIQTTKPLSIEEYSVRLFEEWGIGKKEKDNGVLLLVAVEDRTVKIEVGYGLEGVLPDGLCGEIIRKYIIPEFKKGRFGPGIIAGINKIASVISGKKLDYSEVPRPKLKIVSEAVSFIQSLMILFFLVVFVLVSVLQAFLPRRHYWSTWSSSGSWGGFGGGGFSGFGGGMSGGGGAVGRW